MIIDGHTDPACAWTLADLDDEQALIDLLIQFPVAASNAIMLVFDRAALAL